MFKNSQERASSNFGVKFTRKRKCKRGGIWSTIEELTFDKMILPTL